MQRGSEAADTSFGAAATADGDLIVAASTEGELGGPPNGNRDIYLARIGPGGAEKWSIQIGGAANDSPLGVDVAPDGDIYVAGFTEGFFAAEGQGSADVWLARFDPDDGSEKWRRQFGADQWDRGFDVVAFDDGAYVTGYTASVLDPATSLDGFDGFAARFDGEGNRAWVRQFGTDATDWGQGAALAPDGGVYVTGYTEGDFGGPNAGGKDAFLLRLSPAGEEVWVRQFGSDALDWTQGVGVGSDGTVVVAGTTEGSVSGDNAGDRDLLLASFDADGDEIFVTQLGTPAIDYGFEVRVGDGFIVATGATNGALSADDLRLDAGRDAILVWVTPGGDTIDIEQFGTDADDDTTGLAVLPDGVVLYSGYTFGSLVGPGAGASDIFIGRTEFESSDG